MAKAKIGSLINYFFGVKMFNKNKYSKFRKNFKTDELKYKWLGVLLDAYAIKDYGINIGLKKENRVLACKDGCCACCEKMEITVTEPEFLGISWYVSEKLKGLKRFTVKENLKKPVFSVCPFLVHKSCSIYPVRPLMCRMYHVFVEPCKNGEDVYLSRPQDIWCPDKNTNKKVARKIFSIMGIDSIQDQDRAFNEGLLLKKSKSIYEGDWSHVVKCIELFDQKNS